MAKNENKKPAIQSQKKWVEIKTAVEKKAIPLLDRYFIWILFAVFLLVFYPLLGTQSFDSQDGSYWAVSQKGIADIVTDNFGDQLPVWFILLKGYTAFFSSGETALRAFVLVFLLGALFMLSKICRLFDANEKIICTLFLFNPLTIQIAFILKHFTFLIFISLATFWIFEKCLKEPGQKKWTALFAAAIFLGIYSNLIFLVFLASLCAYGLVLLLRKKISLKKAAVFGIIILVLLIPLAFYFAPKTEKQLTGSQSPAKRDAVYRYSEFVFASLDQVTGAAELKEIKEALYLILLLLLIFSAIEWKNNQKHFTFLIFVLIPFVFFLLAMKYSAVRWRYLGIMAPFGYLLVVPKKTNRFILAVGLVTIALTAFAGYSFAVNTHIPDWRGASQFVANELEKNPGQLVFISGHDYYEGIEYYAKIPGERVTMTGNLEDVSIIREPSVWIIRQSGKFDRVYWLKDQYDIQENTRFSGIKIFHLTKKAVLGSSISKSILLGKEKKARITTNNQTQTCLFENGRIEKDCFAKDWQEIRETVIRSGGSVKNCFFVHPRNNSVIDIVVPNVLLDKSLKIVSGLEETYADKDKAPVFAEVLINNRFAGRAIQPDAEGWFTTSIDSSQWSGTKADVTIRVTSDYEQRRHYCVDAQTSSEPAPKSVLDLIDKAKVTVDENSCNIWQADSIWPHNEQLPPFNDSKIFERWDCEPALVFKQQIWKTAGKSFAFSGRQFQQAVWLHPRNGRATAIEFYSIDTNGLNGFFGLNDLAISKNADARLEFKILANGRIVFDQNFSAAAGWKKFDLPAVFLQNGSLKFQITTSNQNWNHFFFNAFLQPEEKK